MNLKKGGEIMKRSYYKIRFAIANLVDKFYVRKLGKKYGFPIDYYKMPKLAKWAFNVVTEE